MSTLKWILDDNLSHLEIKLTTVSYLQGFDVTLLEAGRQPGGLVAGWKSASGRSVEVGIHGNNPFRSG
jgi:hypothetical protein